MEDRIDVWVLAFRAADEGKRGLMRVFGIDASAAQAIVERVPVAVRRGIPAGELDTWRRALEAIGARVGAGPAGASAAEIAPALEDDPVPVEEPLNEPIVAPPELAASATPRRWTVVALCAGVLLASAIVLLARVGAGSSSLLGSASPFGCIVDGLCVAAIAQALHSAALALVFGVARTPSVASVVVALLGVGWAFGVNQVHAPDPLDAAALNRTIQAEVVAGRVPEARAFFAGPDTRIEGGTNGDGLQLVEALYAAGARRIYAYDGDADRSPEVLVIELPVPLGTRQSIQSAYSAWMGSELSSLAPDERSAPDRGRFWNVPIRRDSGYF